MTSLEQTNGEWSEYRRLVIVELSRLTDEQIKIRSDMVILKNDILKEFVKIQTDIATLKVRSGIWGAVAGALVISISFFMSLLLNVK